MVVFDLKRTFVMPGIHDAHTHLLAASMQKLSEASIGSDSTHLTLADNLKKGECQCSYAHAYGDWLIANFYSPSKFPDGLPDRKYLDDVFPDSPVLIRETTCHSILLNSVGLERVGLEKNVPDPHGGRFMRRPDTGELTGELVESASEGIWTSLPRPSIIQAKRALLYAVRMCHKYGITSCQEASANSVYMYALRELDTEKLLNMTIYTHIVSDPAYKGRDTEANLLSVLDSADFFISEHVQTRFAKFWLDGAPLAPHYTQSDLDRENQPDMSNILIEREVLLKKLQKLDAKGTTCKLHCAGEGSVRVGLDAIEEIRRRNPDGPQHEIAHSNAVHKDDIPRFASLRVTAEMSPAIFHQDDLIEENAHLLRWPFEEVLKANGKITIGSDWILPPSPNMFPALSSIVPKIGLEAILRIITLGGAEAVGNAHSTGSIQVGKKANFIALDRNVFETGFDKVEVLRTWFEGKMVWNSRSDGLHAI